MVTGVGDSRAYWLSEMPGQSRLLTVDDSLAEEQIREGVESQEAYSHPEAHTITRWIGAGADRFDAEVTTFQITEAGLLVLCSDGLWNYFEAPASLAQKAVGSVDRSALGIARHLVRAALRSGGRDNVTVAVLPVRPPPALASIGAEPEES
jgi:serine/threonine protein phosphatase PrpC